MRTNQCVIGLQLEAEAAMRETTSTRALEALEYAISSGREVGVASKILAKYSAKLRFFQVEDVRGTPEWTVEAATSGR